MNPDPPIEPRSSVRSRWDRFAWLWPALVLALAALAYRPLLASALQLPTAHQVESWLFRPSQLPPLLVLGVAGWMLWRRRERLLSLRTTRHRALTVALALAGAGLFVWAALTRSTELLLPSLAANLLAFGSAARGRAGARVLVLPALVLVLGVQIPPPLRSEIVWSLQRATAVSSAQLLGWIGRELTREGVILRGAEHSFHVIDGCSGLQGIATLLLVAVIVGDLFALSGRRRWLLVAIAPLLGHALNAVRIAYIAASPNPEAYAGLQGDHTSQGIALLAAGTAALYGLGRAIAGRVASRPIASAAAALPWRLAAIGLTALAALSATLSPFSPRAGAFPPQQLRFSDARDAWTSKPLRSDPFFVGTLPAGQMLSRRYQRGANPGLIDIVDLFIALDGEGAGDASHLLSSKRRWPGPDWNLQRRRRARIWDLALDADLSVAARAMGTERAVIYSWRLRDRGLWRESWRSLFALEASPLRRERKQAVLRLVAYSPWDEPVAVERAKRRLDRFVTIFREDLEAL